MFLDFLLFLRAGGFKVSMSEWLSLIEGMSMGLHGQSIRGYFILCRTLLVKSETDLDKFEELFYQFFKDVTSDELKAEFEMLLHHPDAAQKLFEQYMSAADISLERILSVTEERLGTFEPGLDNEMAVASIDAPAGSGTPGSMGAGPGGGTNMQGAGGKSIIHMRGDRKFRDWRTDCTIESRQFQMAFRLLRELSRKLDTNEEELDIWGTIHHTCKRGGILDIRMQPPRRNRLKLLVLIDSGGSMRPYEELCSLLFQSLNRANTFSDLKIYYFHNCLEDHVYEDPSIDTDKTVQSDWILKNISDDYKVIFVGDADMALHELVSGSYSTYAHPDGITWFRRFREKYSHSIWLHPQEREENTAWMPESFIEIEKVFPMYRLYIEGLKDGMYKLMKNN